MAVGFELVTHTRPAGAASRAGEHRSGQRQCPGAGHHLPVCGHHLREPLANGAYDVTVHAGDMLYSHEQMTVTIEGTQYNLPDTAAGK